MSSMEPASNSPSPSGFSRAHVTTPTASNSFPPSPSSSKLSPSGVNSSISSTLAPAPATAPKRRSCVVCRSRKVRCDKLSPCSNCRRANIPCVSSSSTDRPPRWARRLERNNAVSSADAAQEPGHDPSSTQVMERVRNLENLVKQLSGQLEQANANSAANSPSGGSSGAGLTYPESSNIDRKTTSQGGVLPRTNADDINVQKQFGRLVVQDANQSLYVSSGFWSTVNDELDGLEIDSHRVGNGDTDTSEDEDEASPGKSPSTQELQRTPSERHAFLFRHNLNPHTPDLREFHPLPSQIPFLLDVFHENVNVIVQIVHIPTVRKMIRSLRGGDVRSLTPANEALMFSIYYAAVTSMEEDDIMTNFGSTKTDLNLKYRLGLEHALAKADFLNVADLVLVQAFTIFLFLVRRHDSPRYVWMMTGLVIRMAQALGLHRDGAHFKHLTPYELEMRRRVWWGLCMLDVRASESQGTEYTIALDSFDTKLPLKINDSDIDPETTEMPKEREGITDITFPLISFKIGQVIKQMMSKGTNGSASDITEQDRLIQEIYHILEREYLQYASESGNIVYWVQIMVTRLVCAKMTLLVQQPMLFSSPSDKFSDDIRNKLLIAAIEISEYNHALNAEQACRQWRWIYQTYTHWYAVVYLLIEVSRRPWSPLMERAWAALHSEWLIPAQSHMDKNLRIWVPLRKLTAKARKHREAELTRLRNDPQAAQWLEMEDQRMPAPLSPGPFPAGTNAVELFREQWRQLLRTPTTGSGQNTRNAEHFESGVSMSSAQSTYTSSPGSNSIPAYTMTGPGSNISFDTTFLDNTALQTNPNPSNNPSPGLQSSTSPPATLNYPTTQTAAPSYDAIPTDWSASAGMVPWLWADADPSIDVFANVDMSAVDVNMDFGEGSDVDWYNWVESAQGLESNVRGAGSW